VSRTLIDLDEELLEAARQVLGTGSKKDTIHEALQQVVALHARRRVVSRLVSGALLPLAPPPRRSAPWRG
jgi:Arc/MetJ family transcription regulator